MAHKENARLESPRHLYSLLTESLQDLSEISSRTVCRSVESGTGRGRKERQHNAREDRETLSAPSRAPPLPRPPPPLADAFRSYRNLGGFSLFLASRACENSTAQDAIGVRRVVEDVQETSCRANYLRLTTLPVRTAEFLLLVFLYELSKNSAALLTQVYKTVVLIIKARIIRE